MRRFSVIKIICCLSIINLGVFNIYLMFKFGFDYWLKWMLVLPITECTWEEDKARIDARKRSTGFIRSVRNDMLRR